MSTELDSPVEIVCPACRGELDPSCRCTSCGRTYPMEDGIPVLLTAPLSPELQEESKWYEAPPRQFARGHDLAHARARSGIAPALREAGIGSSSVVLSVGCGTGLDIAPIRSITQRIVGIDVAFAAVRQFRNDLKLAGYVADCLQMPFADDAFDALIVSGLLHHVAGHEQMQPFLAEFKRVLRPGGAIVVVEPNRLYPLQWVLYPINAVMQRIRPGWRGLVPHERPLSPRFMIKGLNRAGFRQVRYCSSTFLHNRVPNAIGKLIASAERPFCRAWPFKAFGWWLTVQGVK